MSDERFIQPCKQHELRPVKAPIAVLVVVALIAVLFPVLLILLNTPVSVQIAGITAEVIVFSILYYILVYKPVRDFDEYIKNIMSGDFSRHIRLDPAVRTLRITAQNLDHFISGSLNDLLQNLKLQILKTQDNSNDFVAKVQYAVTNSARISLGADYIKTNIESLKLQETASSDEINFVRKNIASYRSLMTEQQQKIEETGTELDAIITIVNDSIQKIDERRKMSEQLKDVTSSLSSKVSETSDNINRVSKGVATLHETIKIVASVANRTNLLAMNASIEAAHAGAAGAGFAVVAEEIRKLSVETAKQVKSITLSLKDMTQQIENAVSSSGETGTAFQNINENVSAFTETFSKLIDDYTELGRRNREVAQSFIQVRKAERNLGSQVEQIASSVDKNSSHLSEINSYVNEITNIIDRNTKEALDMSRSQDPVYMNVITNSKYLEQIRATLDRFRISAVSTEVWLADKTELHEIITAVFDHLDWTISLLNCLHSAEIHDCPEIKKGKSAFDKWLYGDSGKKYEGTEAYVQAVNFDNQLHEKAAMIKTLSDAGKEQEATIEFSELLDLSHSLIDQILIIKANIIKNLGKEENETTKLQAAQIHVSTKTAVAASSDDDITELEEL